jgi:hypothetical protein
MMGSWFWHSKEWWREWKFYLGLGNRKGVVRNSTYERTNIDFFTNWERKLFKVGELFTSSSNRVQQGSNLSGLLLGLYHRGRL